jgi:hypothetical protein
MWDMFKKVNGASSSSGISGRAVTRTCCLARERMIGWYHTGQKLRASDQEINDLFKQFIARPVMVIVDVRPQTVGIPTDAYFAVEEIKDVSTTMLPFLLISLIMDTGWDGDTENLPTRTLSNRS